jgi:hypothetical protein
LEQVLHEASRIMTGLHHALHDAVDGGTVPARQGVHGLVQQCGVRVPQQGDRAVVVEIPVGGTRHELVEDGKGVAHRSAPGSHDQSEHSVPDRDRLLVAELLEVGLQDVGRHEPEGVVVGAGADRADDALRLGGGEDELHVLGRFLHELEESIEALGGHHVGLVDDEDLVPVPHRGEGGAFTQVARVIHAAV